MGTRLTDATTRAAVAFLVERLTEDLARIFDRGGSTAAMLAAVDEQLQTLAAGQLPPPFELRLMLLGYGAHPDYDPAWAALARHS